MRILGTVTDARGRAVEDARVTISIGDAELGTSWTDETGSYLYSDDRDVTGETVVVAVEKEGLPSAKVPEVVQGESVSVDVVLKKTGIPPWVFIAGGAVLLVLILGIVWLARPRVATPEIAVDPQAGGQLVSISSKTDGASIFYSTGEDDPFDGQEYTDPFLVTARTTVRAGASHGIRKDSDIAEETVELQVSTPQFEPAGGRFSNGLTVGILTKTPSASVNYIVTDVANASSPDLESLGRLARYTGPVQIDGAAAIVAIAGRNGWDRSEIGTAVYSFKVARPSVVIDYSASAQNAVTAQTATRGARFRYYLNDTVMDRERISLIVARIRPLNTRATVSVEAYKDGYEDSERASVRIGSFRVPDDFRPPRLPEGFEIPESLKLQELEELPEFRDLRFNQAIRVPN